MSKIIREEILREILKLETSKAFQDTDIPTKIIKENEDILAYIFLASFNNSVEKSNFPSSLKKANITPVFQKGDRNSNDNCRQSAYFQICLKYLSDVFSVNITILCLNSCKNTNAVLAKVTVCGIAYKLCSKSGRLQLIKENNLVHY